MVKKLLDTMPVRLYAAVAGIEQFCDVNEMPFEAHPPRTSQSCESIYTSSSPNKVEWQRLKWTAETFWKIPDPTDS